MLCELERVIRKFVTRFFIIFYLKRDKIYKSVEYRYIF